jgi:DNA-binding response OmpR family regulator
VRILVIEDSARVADLVKARLKADGHEVRVAERVGEATELADREHFDVAIVDVGLPDGSGIEWCRAAREAGSDLGILMLTARSGVSDRIAGLDAGADDYLGKPFAMAELVARVRALGRRGPRWTEAVRTFGRLVVDRERRAVTHDGTRLALTPRELDIVALLAWRDGRAVGREEILETIWGDVSESAAQSLEVLVARIRRKLDERGVAEAIRTVRQVGYAWALERSAPG